MSYSLKDVAIDYLKNKVDYTDSDEANHRLEICNGCEYKSKIGVCMKCGCLLSAKVKYEKSHCPIGKW